MRINCTALAIAASLGALLPALAVDGAPPAGPRLVVSPARLDFGHRGHNEEPSGELTLENTGDAPLVISGIKESCSCIKLRPAAFKPIPPGESRTLAVTMGSGRAMGKLEKKVTIQSNDPASPRIDVPVGMRVLDGYRLTERELRFTGVCRGAPQELHVDVIRTSPGRGVRPPPFTLDVTGFSIRFGQSLGEHFRPAVSAIPGGSRITVTLSPDHPEGRINAELEAKLDGRNLVIPITGEMFAWIVVEPTFLAFSKVTRADPASLERDFRLRSTDDTAFRVLSLVQQPAKGKRVQVDLAFDVESSPDLLAHTVKVFVDPGDQPAGQSSFFGKILVVTDHPEKPEFTVTYSGFFAR